ncbi:MAG: ribonuclease HI family protein [Chloroflexi bacterium]|nr:ribonuclease HI family protein [Chloroflexota bacterium]
MRLIAYADGAARGNPGPAACGAVVLDHDGNELRRIAQAIGRGTNNEAEYRAAIAAVRAALELGATELQLRLDSQLVVRQLQGSYRVRHERLKPLYRELDTLSDQFVRFSVDHVPREQNRRADALANAALDGKEPD